MLLNKVSAELRARQGKGEEVKEEILAKHKLRFTAVALLNAVDTYERLKSNDIAGTEELKKSVQSSIKELCTTICNEIEKA